MSSWALSTAHESYDTGFARGKKPWPRTVMGRINAYMRLHFFPLQILVKILFRCKQNCVSGSDVDCVWRMCAREKSRNVVYETTVIIITAFFHFFAMLRLFIFIFFFLAFTRQRSLYIYSTVGIESTAAHCVLLIQKPSRAGKMKSSCYLWIGAIGAITCSGYPSHLVCTNGWTHKLIVHQNYRSQRTFPQMSFQ